jgi:hypothetical protein
MKALFGRMARADSGRSEASRAPLAGSREETVQRLQVGFFGLGAMILLVGLANIIMNSVQESQASVVPEAAPTVLPSEPPPQPSDPLADAGVVPDLPSDDAPEATPTAGAPPAGTRTPPSPDGTATAQP